MSISLTAVRRIVPIAALALAALVIPASANAARQTGNLLSNPSFEQGFKDWTTWGGSGYTGPVADAPDGTKVGGITNWFANSHMTLNSAWVPTDGNVVAGGCTLTGSVRMNSKVTRTGYLVLRERNGFGVVIRQYTSPRTTLTNKAFQKLTVSGDVIAVSGDRLDVSFIVDGNNMWGGDAAIVDAMDLRCVALPPLAVHMGDSYSSGAGAETMPTLNGRTIDNSVAERLPIINQINPCYRTSNNAARILAKELGGLRVRDYSCAGAKTENILHTRELGIVPLQIGAVTADTSLVTLTIGGNDAALLNILFCAMEDPDCHRNSPRIEQSYGLLEATRTGLRNTLAEITRRAPNAEVRLANYPYLLPTPGSPSGACGDTITQGEMLMGKVLQDRYAEVVREVVAATGNAKVRFVDVNAEGSPFNAVDEHGTRDFCSVSPNRWMNGFIDLQADSRIGVIHPNAKGYQYYAQLYAKSLEGIESVRN